jgi:SAM-dependent methyltransferase
MTHWTEQLYREQADVFAQFFEDRFDRAAEQTNQLLQLLEEKGEIQPASTLDVACGTGGHVVAFAEEGCDAEGLDFSEAFIERAREEAADRDVDDRTQFHVHDMRDLEEFQGSYDLVTNFWNSIGYYDRSTDVEILAELRQLLTNDGVVALEMSNKEFHVRNFESSSVRELDGELHVERKDFDPETGRFPTTVDVFAIEDSRYEHADTIEWENRLYAPVELRELFEDAGFETVSLFGGLDGEAVSLDSKTVIVLAS